MAYEIQFKHEYIGDNKALPVVEWKPAFWPHEEGVAITKWGARKLLRLAMEQDPGRVYRVVNENTGEPVVLPVGTEWWNQWGT